MFREQNLTASGGWKVKTLGGLSVQGNFPVLKPS